MTPTPAFRLTVETDDALLYSETMPPMPVPRVGEDLFVPHGKAGGWWRVENVWWTLPAVDARIPTMTASLRVSWSPENSRSAPTWDEDLGWQRGKS